MAQNQAVTKSLPRLLTKKDCAAGRKQYPQFRHNLSDILFKCGSCGKQLEIDVAGAGMQVDCPACSTGLTVPSSQSAVREAPKSGRTIIFSCKQCTHSISTAESNLGRVVQCPKCKVWVPVLVAAESGEGATEPSQSASDPQSSLPTAGAKRPLPHSIVKHRSKIWIVSSYIVTTCVLVPFLANIICESLFWVLLGVKESSLLGYVLSNAMYAISYIAGPYYSLAHFKKKKTTSDWGGCITPSIVCFTINMILAFLVHLHTLLNLHTTQAWVFLLVILYGIITVAFAKITSNGFRSLQTLPEPADEINLDPKHAQAYLSRGIAKKDKGDLDGAIADYTTAIELDPKRAVVYACRGGAKFLKGDWDSAIADLSIAIELDPKYYNCYMGRGQAKQAKGDQAGADEDFALAIESCISGGSGETLKSAIIIQAPDGSIGVMIEYAVITKHCGERNVDWKLDCQALLHPTDKYYDRLDVELKDGTRRTFWFDITSFYGKL